MIKEFTKGLFKENPIFVIALGLCPTLATSTMVINALGMGAGVIFVLVCSNIFISLLKNFIPDNVRIPAYIVVIASFVTIVQMVMEAYAPALYAALGVFVPLIVVNCIILGRAEAFANKNKVLPSILDGLGMGIGFTLALTLIALIREVLGSGTITLPGCVITVPVISIAPMRVIAFPAGALLVLGLLKAYFQYREGRK
ncbi:MAG: electron transport complex subunit RsxE [Spirochaetia bacterium]|nr:electron transport complex subunit RsxE [Spirochaetia bacterium]MBR4436416.1 electron transport complex subunit RsxE [Spirochaetales bacterium]MBR4796072.1 electron transport complex subunit RsxE [Spirochaetia bacterium]MBR5016179.1 electron transport complex subunit RsxE [Spirochaetia bacterium]MBR5916394.1 electron transport complex subunit RsxE [Spirochaetia bacterium]